MFKLFPSLFAFHTVWKFILSSWYRNRAHINMS